MKIRTVVLDLDDTLIASYSAHRRARRMLRQHGVDSTRFALADRRWWQRYVAGLCTIEELRLGRFADCGVRGQLAVELSAVYRAIANAGVPRRGARRLLLQLRQRGLRTVILTNGTVDPQLRKVLSAGLDGLVDAVVVTEEVGYHKPHPDAFAAALERVAGSPETAVMVGDALAFDIEGALGAGFSRAIWLTKRNPHSDPRVVTIRCLSDVLPSVISERIHAPGVAK